jgi:hypothetical protein
MRAPINRRIRNRGIANTPVLGPDVFLGCVEALRPVPWTGDYSIYEPVRQLFCGALRRAELDGTDPAPYRSMICRRTANPVSRSRPRTSGAGRPAARGNVIGTAGTRPGSLARTAWRSPAWRSGSCTWPGRFGGSWLFKRAKIDAHIEAAAVVLRELHAIS